MTFSREELSSRLLQDFVEEDDEFPEREFGWNIKVMLPLIVVAVLGFMFFAWRSDKIAISRNVGSEVPLVKADTTPIREKPDDPGGMYIANRDKQVYEAIATGSEKELPKVVRVLPEPEEPIAREIIKGEAPLAAELVQEIPAKIEAPSPVAEPLKKEESPTPKAVEVSTNTPQKEIVVKQELMSKDIQIEKPVTDTKPMENKAEAVAAIDPKALTFDKIKVVKKDAKAAEPASKKVDNSSRVQLGSFRSEADVKTTWNKLKKEHSELLAGTDLFIQKADLGEKGLFYRLQVSNIKKESDARIICQKLIENKQGCFVVKK